MKKCFQVLHKKTAFQNLWRRVDEWSVKLPDGSKEEFFFTVAPEIAMTFALTSDKKVIVNYQYHIYDGKWHYELPVGYIDKAGGNLANAKRELLEETGYRARHWHHLGYGRLGKWNSNGVHYFAADNAEKIAEQQLEIGEDIRVKLIPVEKFIKMLFSCKINDNLSIACAYLGLTHLGYIHPKEDLPK